MPLDLLRPYEVLPESGGDMPDLSRGYELIPEGVTARRLGLEGDLRAVRRERAVIENVLDPVVAMADATAGNFDRLNHPLVDLPDIPVKPGDSPAMMRAKGVGNAFLDFAEFFTSPVGVLTPFMGGAPALAKAGLGTAFAGSMAQGVYPAAVEAGRVSVEGDDAEAARAAVGAGASVVLPGMIAAGGMAGRPRQVSESERTGGKQGESRPPEGAPKGSGPKSNLDPNMDPPAASELLPTTGKGGESNEVLTGPQPAALPQIDTVPGVGAEQSMPRPASPRELPPARPGSMAPEDIAALIDPDPVMAQEVIEKLRTLELARKEQLRSNPPDAPPSGGATITGSNEGTASVMPADPVPEPVVNAGSKPRRRAGGGAHERIPDIIDDLEGFFTSKLSLKSALEYDKDFKPTGYLRKIFTRKGGLALDDALDGLQRAGVHLGIEGPGHFLEVLDGASRGRKAARAAASAERRSQADEMKQASSFAKAVSKPGSNKAPVSVEYMMEGDEFTLNGHRVVAERLEWEDGELVSVVLRDGPKYGVQRVGGQEVLHVDSESYKPAQAGAGEVDFAPAPPAPVVEAPPSVAKLRPGENQGDLLSKVEEPFNLAGETATDWETRSAEAEAAARDKADADAAADAQQGKLFEREGKHGKSSENPGGELGKDPGAHPDDPHYTVLPAELPEAVAMVRELTGKSPRVRERLRNALGTFDTGTGEIQLRADLAHLLTEAERKELRAQAAAETEGRSPREFEARYRELLDEAHHEALSRNPILALKTAWHEIGHLVDWGREKMVQGRGNLFGHIAALKAKLDHHLGYDLRSPARPLTEKEKSELLKRAKAEMEAELGGMKEIIREILVEEPIYAEAKITPEDVKRLFGSSNMREEMPELYLWFASQPREVKVEVVKAAMRGMVDARVQAVGGKTKIGTRTVKREVRERSGRNPTPQEIAERFKKLFAEELHKRRTANLKAVKAELEPLIAWWNGEAKMPDYYKTPHEMYADSFSIFMNNPAVMAKRAPMAFRLFLNYMEARPKVKAIYDRIQDDIVRGNVMSHRVDRLRESWRNDAERSVAKWHERARVKVRDFVDNVIYHYDRRLGPVYRLAKGPRGERVRSKLGDFTYRAAEHEGFLRALNNNVGAKLFEHGLDTVDLAELLFHRRVVSERSDMFNPHGWTPKNSLERLAEWETQLGPRRWAALNDARDAFVTEYQGRVVALLNEAGMWSRRLQDKINENLEYATFHAVRGEPDVSLLKVLEGEFGGSVTPHIYKQIGNLGDIKNPYHATVLKGLSLMSAAHRNMAKRAVVDMLRADHPEDIVPAKVRWDGRKMSYVPHEGPDVGTIVYLDHGTPRAWYVRRPVADGLNFGAGLESRLAAQVVKAVGVQKSILTQLNYAFWPVNFLKDSAGFMLKMPGALTPYYWLKNLPRAVRASVASVRGSRNADADAALRRLMVIAKEDPRGVWGEFADEYDLKLASYGMEPAGWATELKGVQKFLKAWDAYKQAGQSIERVNKISGMLMLDEAHPNMPEWKKRAIVRERAGSPDFLNKGASNWQADLLMTFYNAWKQDVRATINAARENPVSFTAKLGAGVAVPSAIMASMVLGARGNDTQELYASVPDYDLQNYLVVPLGWVNKERRDVAYLRLPLPDALRLVHGAIIGQMTGRGQGMVPFVAGQAPGLNPLIQATAAWTQFELNGKNPYDMHRGGGVLTDRQFEAGGSVAREALGKWTWNTLGGGIVHRFQNPVLESPPASEVQNFLALPVVSSMLGRWVKVSNRGVFDADRRAMAPVTQEHAQVQVAVRALLQRWVDNGVFDGPAISSHATPDAEAKRAAAVTLTDSERMLMRSPYAVQYFREKLPALMKARQSLLAERLSKAQSKDEKRAILTREAN